MYGIDNLEAECMNWFEFWCTKSPSDDDFPNGLIDVLNHTALFPAVQHAIQIALTLPVKTCTNERSFSTLRRVKTWLRSTMTDSRLSGLCMLSVHRQKIAAENKAKFLDRIIDRFGQDQRRLQFLFTSCDQNTEEN